MLNAWLIEFEEERHDSEKRGPISETSLVNTQLPNEIYYNMRSELNKKMSFLWFYHLSFIDFSICRR